MRGVNATIGIAVFLVVSCGDNGEGGEGGPSATSDVDPCSLLSDADLTAVLGVAYPAEESEPAGPFTGCSWGTGEVLVSIAPSDTVITAPGEGDCPSAGLGEESYACPGRVLVLTDGTHVTVSTISPLTEDQQLLALAERVLENLSG